MERRRFRRTSTYLSIWCLYDPCSPFKSDWSGTCVGRGTGYEGLERNAGQGLAARGVERTTLYDSPSSVLESIAADMNAEDVGESTSLPRSADAARARRTQA